MIVVLATTDDTLVKDLFKLNRFDLARLVAIVRGLPPQRLEAWLTYGERLVAGMPVADAEALMWRELAAAGEA